MPDVHSPEQRSRNMAAIRSTNTRPEMVIRSGLHRRGFRFRLHQKKLPGNPDLVLRKYNAVIFVNGCFWHGHGCKLFVWPQKNRQFWRDKISSNVERDEVNRSTLEQAGWRVLSIWECALKGKEKLGPDRTLDLICEWLNSGKIHGEIPEVTPN